MNNLMLILNKLKNNAGGFNGCYYIPEAWNCTGYREYSVHNDRIGEINVNPYSFFSFCVESHILGKEHGASGLRKNTANSIDLANCAVYSMFPRMFTAWDHYGRGGISNGTFLKAICLLPYLKGMNVNVIYILPLFECSTRYKKGELGSPYAIKNVYKLDPGLHDELLGNYSEELLEIEFKAFIEACHILGIRVMVDFVFRTVSRDNDLIIKHPEWFYWIDLKHNSTFKAPFLNTRTKLIRLNDRTLSKLYRSEYMAEYLSQFTFPPNLTDPVKWEKISSQSIETGENILDLIEKEFGATTAPGFSDVVNDPQPPWTDVTYLKFYFDVHEEAKKYIPEGNPPYISQDGVSLNARRGADANSELWEYVSDVIPYYQRAYGIDGARIDMGHALPPELNRVIVEKAKKINEDFIFWSEEFDPAKAEIAKKDGFSLISGYMYSVYKTINKPSFNKELFDNTLLKSSLPVAAALETPDTPRAFHVHSDKRRIEQLVMINSFIPNTVPLINNGFDTLEVQPMNLGLDNSEEGRFVLDKSDPMYGKLAFFDSYTIHWLNSERTWIQSLIAAGLSLRRRFSGLVCSREFFRAGKDKNKKVTFICYSDDKSENMVFLIANRSLDSCARVNLGRLLQETADRDIKAVNIVFECGKECSYSCIPDKKKMLKPGELLVGYTGTDC